MRSPVHPGWILAGCVAMPLAVWAAETVESLGFDPVQVEQSMFGALRGGYYAPDVPAAVRALPAKERAAAVQALGAYAKTWFASAEFKKEYLRAYKETKPRTFTLPSGGTGKTAQGAVDKAKGKANTNGNYKLDKNPRQQLEKRLQSFLDATADVDFDAPTVGEGSARRFERAEHESKPREWKMCYRAGQETTEAVRAFARDWLAELK